MKNMEKMTVYVIHHSHTDVGYTDTQEKMKRHHIGFIREVLDLAERQPAFKWNCESYWCVEQFLAVASKEERERFIALVKSGNICVSGNYLNLTELVSYDVLSDTLARGRRQMEELGLTVKSGMTADINGYSWGYCDALYENGIRGFLSCIHTHHGYHPLLRKQVPFLWESPKGNRLLVWNGDHYLLGNEMGIAQASEFEYTVQDGLSWAKLSPFEKAEKRLFGYVDTLKKQGYEYDFLPLSVSGNMTDNSPPSLKVLEFTEKWNAKHGDEIEVKMATLDEFFDRVRPFTASLPVYRGDWTDWWADGVGSTPGDVAHYRAAARKYSVARKLDPTCKACKKSDLNEALFNLMFYAEHTWGYSSSITEPYHPQVNNLDQWKRLYALKANEAATIALEDVAASRGETQISLHKKLTFKAVNPHDFAVKDMLVLDLEHFYGYEHFDVVDAATGKTVPYQLSRYSRGPEMCILLDMAAKEEKTFLLREKPEGAALASPGLMAERGIEGIYDLEHRFAADLVAGGTVNTDFMENEYFRVRYRVPDGVISVYDKKGGRELVKSGESAFRPVYERTDPQGTEDQLWVRRNMGRNRKAPRTTRSYGELSDVAVLENGDLYLRVELKYRLAGTESCSVILTAYKFTPRITADFRLHKTSVWSPENLYLSLPFSAFGGACYLDKTGAVLRPRIDQLPGTCTDFYAVQNGLAYVGERDSLLVTTKDAPLIWLGRLDAHPIRLAGAEGAENLDNAYSWVMNNFWETNFKADLAGFYQFRYDLALTPETQPQAVFRQAEAVNEGVLCFYSFQEEA